MTIRYIYLLLCVFVPCLFSPSPVLAERVDIDGKIGQMLMVGFRGCEVDEESLIVKDIRAGRVGGVILFDYDVLSKSPVRNISSPAQVRKLVRTLKAASTEPLFVAVDQEGGRVCRLKERFGFPPSLSEGYLGRRDNIEETGKAAETTAQTLRQLGINLNFAPVVDLNVNPENPIIGKIERSFSSDPACVILHAEAMIDAFHAAGVLSAIKHFPGHGSSTADSHKGFVDVTRTWSARELEPFAALIGSKKADMVMTAHIVNEHLDPHWPATLSRAIIGGMLRRDLGYEGVVISDDMQMGAIRLHYGLELAIERAITAGCDILIFGNNSVYEEDIASRACAIIKALVHGGRVRAERIEQSYQRIMKLKKRLYCHTP